MRPNLLKSSLCKVKVKHVSCESQAYPAGKTGGIQCVGTKKSLEGGSDIEHLQ